MIYGDARVTLPSPSTREPEGSNWNSDINLVSPDSNTGASKTVGVGYPGPFANVRP